MLCPFFFLTHLDPQAWYLVPKRWFLHFYVLSSVFTLLVIQQITSVCFHLSDDENGVDNTPSFLVWCAHYYHRDNLPIKDLEFIPTALSSFIHLEQEKDEPLPTTEANS